MRKTALFIMLVTILSKIIGFIRDITLSYFYGAGVVSDVFLLSQTIPNTLFTLLGTAVMFGFIPVYARLVDDNREDAEAFASSIMTLLLIVTAVIVFFGYVFIDPLMNFFASGFTGEARAMAMHYTQILLPGLFFTGVLYVLRAYLQVHEKYVITTMLGFPFNFFIILGIVLSAFVDIRLLPWFALVAIAAQLLLFIPDLKKLNFSYRPKIRTKKEHLKELFVLVLPMMISSGFAQLAIVTTRSLATEVGVGSISALNYAERLNGFVLGLFITSIVTVLYPMLSRMQASGDQENFQSSVADSLLMTAIFVIPVSVGCMLLATPIVSILFTRGAFDENALRLTSQALFAYSIGMLPLGLREIFQKVLYAMEDTKSPLVITALTAGVQILLCFLLYRPMGITGIALATSVASIFAMLAYIIVVRRKNALAFDRSQIQSLFKIVLASIVMAIVVYFANHAFMSLSTLIHFILTVGLGIIAYFFMVIILCVDEAKLWFELLKQRKAKS